LTIAPGTRLGVYEVTGSLGEGGMGQVFRATDTKLKRQVAVKILPPGVAADQDRLARFQREAEVLASLNHPNIAGIYGVEERDGITALIMELVEGEDLSQRLERGPLPFDEALPIAKQIVDALDAAHDRGIIHRDLKPANIKLRPDGTVKVLDFGLAKALEPNASSGQTGATVSMSPTITTPAMTQAGVILGTAAYMSPEQARGRVVDKRADIWAFGAVLFEMLAGRRPFDGEDMTEVLGAVVRLEPQWATLPAATPARVTQALRLCLRKDPKQRVADIRDVRLALEGAFETGPPEITASSIPARSVVARALPWLSAAAALMFAVAWLMSWAPWRAQTSVDRTLVRLDVDLGADVSLPDANIGGSGVAISPDGTRLVYASGTPTKLFIRRLDRSQATELPGTQGARVPFFSADSQWVGFVSGGKARRISVEGGAVVPLGGEANVTAPAAKWGDDGSLFVTSGRNLLRLPADGGPPEAIAEAREGELGVNNPEPLPGSKAVLFIADNPGPVEKTTIELVTLSDHQRRTLIRGGASPRYLETSNGAGHLIYLNQATLFAIPFDLATLTTRGTALPVVDDVGHEDLIGTGQLDISRTGTLVYRRSVASSALSIVQWVDASGKKEPLQTRPAVYRDVSVSPDGKRIAFGVLDGGNTDIWVYDPQRDAMTRLTIGGMVNRYPIWSPDGRLIVFSTVGRGIFAVRADGASQAQAVNENRAPQHAMSFTPDGRRLSYDENLGGGGQLWTMTLIEENGRLKLGKAESFLKSASTDTLPAFSPDGRWVAYQSNESGTTEVFVRPFPPPAAGVGGRWQISTRGGTMPRWSHSGRDLVYRSGDQLMAVGYTVKDDTFVAEKPRVWLAKLGGTDWDLAPDGKRVAVIAPVESPDGPKQDHGLVFVQHFFDELRRRVPLER